MVTQIFYLIIALAVCISVHEASHAYIAYKLGDSTAKREGRMTLNPLAHLDLLGTLMIFLVHFGWGKPVPVNYKNLKHPKRDSALVSVAGPLSNLLTAFVMGFLMRYVPLNDFLFGLLKTIFTMSIVLFLFNLIPIAPLDGSKFIGYFIPKKREDWYERFVMQGPIFLIVLVFGDRLLQEVTGFSVLGTYLNLGYDFIATLILLST